MNPPKTWNFIQNITYEYKTVQSKAKSFAENNKVAQIKLSLGALTVQTFPRPICHKGKP